MAYVASFELMHISTGPPGAFNVRIVPPFVDSQQPWSAECCTTP